MMTLLICTVTMSALALFYMAITPLLAKRYSAKGRYYAWLVIVVGLIIPFRPHFNSAIVKVNVPTETLFPIVQIGNGTPFALSPQNTPLPMALPSISLWQVVAIVWLIGIVAVFAYHVIKHYRFMKMVRRWSKSVIDEASLGILQSLKSEMGINKQIKLEVCPCIGSPMLVGFVKPKILIPQLNFAKDELRFIFKHELIHFKRKDLWYKCFVLVATAIHWFNPIVYLMAKSINVQCELSCDAEVVKSTNQDMRLHYSETIIGVIKYHSKLNTALSTNFYGGKKGMKNRIFSIMDRTPKKAGLAVICGALIVTLGTGVAFASNASAGSPQANGYTVIASSEGNTAVFTKEKGVDKSKMYEIYQQYGITYDKATDSLYYNSMLVRYFEDYYPIDENSSAGFDYLNKDGKIDVHGIRDLSNLIRNSDGSFDPSGKLIGVKPYTQAEFDARDIRPQQNATYTIGENSYVLGETFSQIFSAYKDYGVVYEDISGHSGLGNVYYNGQLVKTFVDEQNNGGVFMLSSIDGGSIIVRTVYDANGNLAGVKVD